MAAKQSAEMAKACDMVLAGVTPYQAAKECGITRSAIYMSPWYKAHKAAQQTRNCKEYPK